MSEPVLFFYWSFNWTAWPVPWRSQRRDARAPWPEGAESLRRPGTLAAPGWPSPGPTCAGSTGSTCPRCTGRPACPGLAEVEECPIRLSMEFHLPLLLPPVHQSTQSSLLTMTGLGRAPSRHTELSGWPNRQPRATLRAGSFSWGVELRQKAQEMREFLLFNVFWGITAEEVSQNAPPVSQPIFTYIYACICVYTAYSYFLWFNWYCEICFFLLCSFLLVTVFVHTSLYYMGICIYVTIYLRVYMCVCIHINIHIYMNIHIYI